MPKYCYQHPQTVAIEKCTRCQRNLCEQCQVLIKQNVFCPECARLPLPEMRVQKHRHPELAALLSLVFPGLGQVYNGQIGKGLAFFLMFWLVIPWLYSVYDAYETASRINQRAVLTVLVTDRPGGWFLLMGFLAIGGMVMFGAYRFLLIDIHKDPRIQAAKKNLRTLSEAAEKFAQDQGHYPDAASDLYYSDTPYMDEIFCGITVSGYTYQCQFERGGYTIDALPRNSRQPELKIMTGGILELMDDRTDGEKLEKGDGTDQGGQS